MSDTHFSPFETNLDREAALKTLREATSGADDGELLGGGELGEVESFEFQVEVVGDFGEGGRGTVGDDLEAEGIGLPAFEGVAEDGDLAGEGLDGEEEEEEETHGNGGVA